MHLALFLFTFESSGIVNQKNEAVITAKVIAIAEKQARIFLAKLFHSDDWKDAEKAVCTQTRLIEQSMLIDYCVD